MPFQQRLTILSLREKKTLAALPISPSVVMEHHLKQMAHNVLHPYSPLCMVLPNLILLYHPSKVKQQTHQTCKRVITFCFGHIQGAILYIYKSLRLNVISHIKIQIKVKKYCRSILRSLLVLSVADNECQLFNLFNQI